MKILRKLIVCILSFILILEPLPVRAAEGNTAESAAENQVAAEVAAPHALLMEVSTGTVLMAKAADEKVHPASVTKVMTMLLILEAVEEGRISLDDVVTVSEYAASMGGSQVYLEPFEKQTVETLLKCVAVASANDAAVTLAEYISGSEGDFVKKMNEKAAELGMTNTHFANCCGLDDDDHLTTARDVALMSRELLKNHPDIHKYCTIWMENITHTTAKGSFEFGLTNTNKLVKQYEYATGLKTGYTSQSGFCVAASAKKDDIELVAVIMGGADSASRFQDAITLMNSGFACCSIYRDENRTALKNLPVTGGIADEAELEYADEFAYVFTDGSNPAQVEKILELPEGLEAPVPKGEAVGRMVYKLGGRELGQTEIRTAHSVEQARYRDYMEKAFRIFLL